MADLVPVNFDVYRGERASIPFAMNPPRNVSLETHKFTLATKENSSTKILGPTALAWDDATIGTGHFSLAPADTDRKPAVYYWDVWRTDPGFEICEAKGTLTILADTRVPPVS